MTPSTVTILGAGAMGSALATPLRDAGWDVRLWGTWLDDDLVAEMRAGRPHPRTGVALVAGVQVFDSPRLAEAVEGAALLVLAVTSAGVEPVTTKVASLELAAEAILMVSKGFSPEPSGRIRLLPEAMRSVPGGGENLPPVVGVGGPCKANEVAARRPTASVFASEVPGLAAELTALVSTDDYRVQPSLDLVGVEVCAALKNAYAIALGVADGLSELGGQPWHDLKAATFAQALAEMTLVVGAMGGDPLTATGLAGAGDLEVTGLSGRNKLLGVRVGSGEAVPDALEAMRKAEQTVEGVDAARHAAALVDAVDRDLWQGLPLLRGIREVLFSGGDPVEQLVPAVLPRHPG